MLLKKTLGANLETIKQCESVVENKCAFLAQIGFESNVGKLCHDGYKVSKVVKAFF